MGRMSGFHRWGALLAGLLAVSHGFAADGARGQDDSLVVHSPPVLRHYGAAEGLPQVSVNAILRTRDGFLWVGTFGGLARFDGHEFRTFLSGGGDAGPPSRRVVSLHEDARQRLWIGTEDAGISMYAQGRFRQLSICGGNCRVNRMFSVDDRTVWVLTANAVMRIDADSLQVLDATTIAGSYSLVAHVGQHVLVGGASGLMRVSGTRLVRVQLPDGYRQVDSMVAAGTSVWMILDGGNLYRHEIGSGRWTFVRGGLPRGARVLSDGAGGIYLSDEAAGVRVLARDGSELPLDGVAQMYVNNLVADAGGALWIGTPAKGLWLLRHSRVDLVRSRAVPDAPGRVVAPDGAGGMWLAMSCMSLWHLAADGRATAWPAAAAVGEGCIHGMAFDAATGRLWIGTSGGELARVADGRIERMAAWPQAGQIGIWILRSGEFWTANQHFVGRLQLMADGAVKVAGRVDELAGMEVKRVVDARAGGVWVVGDRGAFRVVDDAVVERWTPAQGINGRFFRALHEDADGVLWIGSYGNGLIRIENGSVRQYTETDGLFDDTVSCILPAADGRLWLAGNRGIGLLLNPKLGSTGPIMRSLTIDDGLDPAELNGSPVLPCVDDGAGHLWFAMMVGFARVTPARLQGWVGNAAPRAYIDHAAVSQNVVDLFQPADLGVNAGNLDIRYGAIAPLDSDKLRFRYRLTGAGSEERDWIDAGSNRSLLLPVLPWGRLRFEVQVREPGGAWSPSAALQLNRPRPWYKYRWTWMAASLASLLALLWLTRERGVPDVDEALLARLRRPVATDADSGR